MNGLICEIVYTPPSNAHIFGDMMAEYRQLKTKNPEFHFRTSDTSRDAVHDFFELFHGTHAGTDADLDAKPGHGNDRDK